MRSPTNDYLLPAAVAFASLGPIAWGFAALPEHTALSFLLGAVLLLPLLAVSVFAFVLAVVLGLRRSAAGRRSKPALAYLAALVLAVAVAGLPPFPWLGVALASATALGSVMWLGRVVWSPLPLESAS